MNKTNNHKPLTDGIVILTADEVHELEAIAMTLDQLAELFIGFAKTIRQLTGEDTEDPKS